MSGFCTMMTMFFGFFALQLYTPMITAMTTQGLFYFYALVAAIIIPITFFFMEETMGEQVGWLKVQHEVFFSSIKTLILIPCPVQLIQLMAEIRYRKLPINLVGYVIFIIILRCRNIQV